jgi:hypothetical protein
MDCLEQKTNQRPSLIEFDGLIGLLKEGVIGADILTIQPKEVR